MKKISFLTSKGNITTNLHVVHDDTPEKVVLAGLLTSDIEQDVFNEDINEMQMLCETAGADVIATITQKRDRPAASTFMGYGKLEEIKGLMKNAGARTLVIDTQLAPGQVRNIEKIIDAKVIDRGQLILDIFAAHVRTNEAKIQVELAQMRTLYPRLTHAWTHFSQQVGGIGTRGPGEKQLEVDRRLVQKKISDLKERLEKIEKDRVTQRKNRSNVFQVAIVGYTNVGKSSLLNSLCGSDILVEDKLFATLDTSTRKVYIPGAGQVVISDTVGFLRKLPHHLVASFKSTLSIIKEAQLLIVVLDASSYWADQQSKTVHDVLGELEADTLPQLTVFNKFDLVDDPFIRKKLSLEYPDAHFVSTFNKDDMARLKNVIGKEVVQFEKEKKVAEIIYQKSKENVYSSD
ncbi:MAG: GTPase HflX [Chitinispirillaceae bacterium]|nr:GTPase HflX [Chitinispirillaceae bacterium]